MKPQRHKDTKDWTATWNSLNELFPVQSGSWKIWPMCGALRIGKKGRGIQWDFDSVTVTEFARTLHLDRPVIDRTGITGLYRFHLEFALDRTTSQFLPGPENGRGWQESTGGLLPVDDPTAGPFIRTAIEEQLGLRLEPTRGPSDFLIIDSIARPTEN